jgi:SAM-dependent methyltransferase
MRRLEREFSIPQGRLEQRYSAAERQYVEPFFKELAGAREVVSVDVSGYEGATIVHDMNLPFPAALSGKFDAVIEAGSLEHILNFPVAMKSVMSAVKVGGRLFIQTPANNYLGHGFFQFSPELFYRVLSKDNGFEVVRMILFEHFYPCHFFEAPWYAVKDPDEVRSRVQLLTKRPVLMLIEARRVAEVPIFEKVPQQSDYVQLWSQTQAATSAAPAPAPGLLHRSLGKIYSVPLALVGSLWLQYLANRKSKPSFSNQRFFTRTKG